MANPYQNRTDCRCCVKFAIGSSQSFSPNGSKFWLSRTGVEHFPSSFSSWMQLSTPYFLRHQHRTVRVGIIQRAYEWTFTCSPFVPRNACTRALHQQTRNWKLHLTVSTWGFLSHTETNRHLSHGRVKSNGLGRSNSEVQKGSDKKTSENMKSRISLSSPGSPSKVLHIAVNLNSNWCTPMHRKSDEEIRSTRALAIKLPIAECGEV